MTATAAQRFRALVTVLPLFSFMLAIYHIPLALMLKESIGPSGDIWHHYGRLLDQPVYLRILGNTFEIALIVTVVAVLLGYPLAYWLTTLSPRALSMAMGLVMLPFWTSLLVRAYAWIVILGRRGIVNNLLLDLNWLAEPLQLLYNRFSVVLGTVHILLPFMVFPLYSVMARMDRQILRASYSLGATGWQTFWRVYLPVTLPGLAAGCLLVFVQTLGFFVTPALLGGGNEPMIATVLEQIVNVLLDWGLGSALAVTLLVVTTAFYLLFGLAARWRGSI